jgi:hypothetical protein
MVLCLCGCGKQPNINRRYAPNCWNKVQKRAGDKIRNEIHFCECGCNNQIVYKKFYARYGWPKYICGHHNKVYIKQNRKGKKFEDIYGKKRAKQIKNKISQKYKGKNYEEIYGKEKAILKRNKTSSTHKLKYINNPELRIELSKRVTKWTKERIINSYLKLPNIYLVEWNDYRMKGKIPDMGAIRKQFGSLDNFINITQKPFKINVNEWLLGKHEKKLINKKEKELNIKFRRQYYVNGFWLDGYNKDNNIAIEVDEIQHKWKKQKLYDIKREQIIKEILGCIFIRIKDGWN